jgi:hypothetical protein
MTSLVYPEEQEQDQDQAYIRLSEVYPPVPKPIRPIYSLSRPYEAFYLSEKLNRFSTCSTRVEIPEKVVQWLCDTLKWSPPSVLTLTGVSSSTFSYVPYLSHILPILTHPLPPRVSQEIPTMITPDEEFIHSLNLVKVMDCVLTLTRSYLEDGEDGEDLVKNLTHLVQDRENGVYMLAFRHVILLYIPRLNFSVLWTLDEDDDTPFYIAMGPEVRVGRMGTTDYRVEYLSSEKYNEDREAFDALITTADKRLEMVQRPVPNSPHIITLRNRFIGLYMSYDERIVTDTVAQTSLELFRKNGVDVWTTSDSFVRHSISRAMLFDGSVVEREYFIECEDDIQTGLRRRHTIRRESETLFEEDADGVKVDKLAEIGRNKDSPRIGWKVAKANVGGRAVEVIVQLAIPENAQVVVPASPQFSTDHIKMRCDHAVVVSIEPAPWSGYESRNGNEDEKIDTAHSFIYGNATVEYIIGHAVRPDRLDTDIHRTCTSGIHFYPDFRSLSVCYRKEKLE